MKLKIHPEALLELEKAVDFYEERRESLGQELFEEVPYPRAGRRDGPLLMPLLKLHVVLDQFAWQLQQPTLFAYSRTRFGIELSERAFGAAYGWFAA